MSDFNKPMAKDDDGVEAVRMVLTTPAGPVLDRIVSSVVFDQSLEECEIAPNGWHIRGSHHFHCNLEGKANCGSPVPEFTTDWGLMRALVEWATTRYGGVEIFWDSGSWYCNLNDCEAGKWFRLVHTSSAESMQEALAKAIVIARIEPQKLPLQVRQTVDMIPVTPSKKTKKRKKK